MANEATTKEDDIKKLMSINAQMFEGTIRVLSQQNKSLHEQNAELLGQIATLQRALLDKIAGLC